MPTYRENPYGAFNFIVALGDAQGDGTQVVGGFSDCSGLGFEVSYSDYRNGNEKVNTVRHVQNTFKNDEVVLKRGLVGSPDLFAWLKATREGEIDRRTVSIQLLDEARQTVATWTLNDAQAKKWTGPTMTAKGGGEVAMEELHLVHEGIDYK
jgi:phage tail-like protein